MELSGVTYPQIHSVIFYTYIFFILFEELSRHYQREITRKVLPFEILISACIISILLYYISQVTTEENLFNNQNFSLTDHFLSSPDQGEILCWSMDGFKGEGLNLSNRWLLSNRRLDAKALSVNKCRCRCRWLRCINIKIPQQFSLASAI